MDEALDKAGEGAKLRGRFGGRSEGFSFRGVHFSLMFLVRQNEGILQ